MSSLQAPRAGDPTLADAAEAEASVLYELHGARVHAFCLGRLGDREEAADAVQDTFAKAWIALRDGCEVRQPLAWLLTIAGNVCASRYRARRARPIETPLRDDAEGPAFDQRPPELVGLPTALRALPEEQRRAFVLRELRGCSYEEIGLDLGVSYSSVAAPAAPIPALACREPQRCGPAGPRRSAFPRRPQSRFPERCRHDGGGNHGRRPPASSGHSSCLPRPTTSRRVPRPPAALPRHASGSTPRPSLCSASRGCWSDVPPRCRTRPGGLQCPSRGPAWVA